MTDDQEFNRSKTEVESITRRGEEIDGKEPEAGRHDVGLQGPTGRMAGTSDARDYTSVDPHVRAADDDKDRSTGG